MVENIEFRIEEFEKFYNLLMSNSPEGYIPWFFPCESHGKNPSTKAILKINPNSKGSWHHESARLNKEQCIQHIKDGYNIGISARKEDALIIGDIDNIEYLYQIPKNTLTVISRKRIGWHFFGWDKDGSAKVNIPTENGEMRSNNQYVLSCGSYVPFNLENKKDLKEFNGLPAEVIRDSLLGYYSVKEAIVPRALTLDELPEIFKDKLSKNVEFDNKIKFKEENKSFKEFSGDGKYSDLLKLKVSDILEVLPTNKRVGHPLHDSDTDANFSFSKDGVLCHCWRHLVSLNAVQFLCVKAKYISCEDAGTPHKVDGKKEVGRSFSKIKGDKKALEAAYQEALKMGLIKEWKPKEKITTIRKDEDKEISSNQQTTIFRQLARDYYMKQPYFFDSARLWWLWDKDKKCWSIKDETDIMNQFDKYFVQESEKSNIKNGIIEALKKYGRTKQPEEIKPTWIQFKNKIYDISNGEVFEASPKYFIANPIPWEVGESEDTPNIDKLFASWVEEKDIKKLYELIAFVTVPEMFIHSFHFLFSPPGMGKGTYVNLILNFIGKYNAVSTSLARINSNPRFETYHWNKKLLITMSEVSDNNDLKNSGLINQATGGDPLRAEAKGGGGFDFVNYGKFIYPTNKLLKVDAGDGFGRRVRTLKFITRFEKEKDILKTIPEAEYKNLAKKCLRIAKELYEIRRFTGDVDISERMNKYQEESKTILERFIDDCCDITDSEAKTAFDEFYCNYCKFIIKNKERPAGKIEVSKELKKLGYETKTTNWRVEKEEFEQKTLSNSQNSFEWISKRTLYGIRILPILPILHTS